MWEQLILCLSISDDKDSLSFPVLFCFPPFPPGDRYSVYGGEKVYLGVRVKMPVRDLLRNIRLAKGCESQDLQVMANNEDFK